MAPVHHTPMLRPATNSLCDKHPPASLSASSLRPSVSPLLVRPTALMPGRLLSRLVSSTRSEGRGANKRGASALVEELKGGQPCQLAHHLCSAAAAAPCMAASRMLPVQPPRQPNRQRT